MEQYAGQGVVPIPRGPGNRPRLPARGLVATPRCATASSRPRSRPAPKRGTTNDRFTSERPPRRPSPSCPRPCKNRRLAGKATTPSASPATPASPASTAAAATSTSSSPRSTCSAGPRTGHAHPRVPRDPHPQPDHQGPAPAGGDAQDAGRARAAAAPSSATRAARSTPSAPGPAACTPSAWRSRRPAPAWSRSRLLPVRGRLLRGPTSDRQWTAAAWRSNQGVIEREDDRDRLPGPGLPPLVHRRAPARPQADGDVLHRVLRPRQLPRRSSSRASFLERFELDPELVGPARQRRPRAAALRLPLAPIRAVRRADHDGPARARQVPKPTRRRS